MRKMSRNALTLVAGLIAFAVLGHQAQGATGAPYAKGDVFAAIGLGLIRHMDSAGTTIQVLDTTSGSFNNTGMCFDAAGNLYATNFNAGNMTKFDNQGNIITHPWGGGFDTLPESCVVDASGNIYTGEVDGANLIRKFDSAGTPLTTFSPSTGSRGVDWIDLAADQCTMYYTSEDSIIRRFNVCTDTQLTDFATGLNGPCFALRIGATGEVLVACRDEVVRLDATGATIQTYAGGTLGTTFLFSLNLDPDGTSFWTADIFSGRIVRVDIASGTVLTGFTPDFNASVAGLAIFGEPTAGGGDIFVPPTVTLQPCTLSGSALADFNSQCVSVGNGVLISHDSEGVASGCECSNVMSEVCQDGSEVPCVGDPSLSIIDVDTAAWFLMQSDLSHFFLYCPAGTSGDAECNKYFFPHF